MQRHARGRLARRMRTEALGAATHIQSCARRRLAVRLLNEAIAAATQIERYARGRLLRKRLPELRADLARRREEARAAAAAANEKAREEFAAAKRRAAGAPNFDLRPGRRASLAAIASGVTPTGGRDRSRLSPSTSGWVP